MVVSSGNPRMMQLRNFIVEVALPRVRLEAPRTMNSNEWVSRMIKDQSRRQPKALNPLSRSRRSLNTLSWWQGCVSGWEAELLFAVGGFKHARLPSIPPPRMYQAEEQSCCSGQAAVIITFEVREEKMWVFRDCGLVSLVHLQTELPFISYSLAQKRSHLLDGLTQSVRRPAHRCANWPFLVMIIEKCIWKIKVLLEVQPYRGVCRVRTNLQMWDHASAHRRAATRLQW